MSIQKSTLYVVATPIGNLADITYRAVEVLRGVDRIAAEDTRHSRVLLDHYQIRTPTFAVHDHNEDQQCAAVLRALQAGESVALISDAGTPLINDPGYVLVNAVRAAGFKVAPVPGPSSVVSALSIAGLPTDRFCFEGFLPAKTTARQARLESMRDEPRTAVFLESSHRILDAVEDVVTILGAEREIVIARELTKTFETVFRAPAADVLAWMRADSNQQLGEFVLLIAGHRLPEDADLDANAQRTAKVLVAELPVKQAAALTAELTGAKKNAVYKWLLAREG